MNKHVILISVLMTAGVSLHTLSYALDDTSTVIKEEYTPLDIKQIKTEKVEKPEIKIAKLPEETKKDKIEPVNNKEPAETAKQSTEEEKMIPVSNLHEINYKVASGLIPSKNYKEIVKEAKVAGGRVDPFLSLKPPEIDKLPELPVQEKQVVIEPIPTVQQDFPVTKKTRPLAQFKPQKQFKVVIKPEIKHKEELAETSPNLQEGFVLNGIITGTKPLALIKVDNVNKILGMGDIIFRKNQKITIVSIDNDSKAITISDDKNRKAKLEME